MVLQRFAVLLLQGRSTAPKHSTDIVFLEVEDDATHAIFKFDQFPGLHACQAVDAGDSVPYLENGANFLELCCTCRTGELLAEDAGTSAGLISAIAL